MPPPFVSRLDAPKHPGIKSGRALTSESALSVEAKGTAFHEIQEDELLVLAAMYGDDFRRVESKHSAWKVNYNQLSCPKFGMLTLTEI